MATSCGSNAKPALEGSSLIAGVVGTYTCQILVVAVSLKILGRDRRSFPFQTPASAIPHWRLVLDARFSSGP